VFIPASARVKTQAPTQFPPSTSTPTTLGRLPGSSRTRRAGVAVLTTAVLAIAVPATANAALSPPGAAAAPYPSDTAQPNLASVLGAYSAIWAPNGNSNLHGRVLNKRVAERDDKLAVWINRNANQAARSSRPCRTPRTRTRRAPPYDQSLDDLDRARLRSRPALREGPQLWCASR
jgi:hypothetical protein